MKKYSILFCLFLQLAMAFAQAPEKMSYQAVVRNNNNMLVSNHAVGMRISILQGSATGTAVYTENQTPTTNANGLIAIEIGTGTVVSGTFANIDWANGPFFVKTETDPNGGTAYTLTSSNQLLSVPYALHSKTSSKTDTARVAQVAQTALNGVPSGGQQGQSLTMCDGEVVWAFGGLCPAKISSFNCADTVHVGTIMKNNVTSIYGCSTTCIYSTITYTSGNGGVYDTQTINSTGVLGLTATLRTGTLNNGNGILSLQITGTPTNSGIASFTLKIGNKTCVLNRTVLDFSYPANSVFCNGTPTAIVNVTNPITGKTWMDRNLGASRAAIRSTDSLAYGDLYQWGRSSDGHQCRNSEVTYLSSTIDYTGNNKFISCQTSQFGDWRNPQNPNLWQQSDTINNPCPIGYRVPTKSELDNERISWLTNNSIGAFNSNLKLPLTGFRHKGDGSIQHTTDVGVYWSNTISILEWGGYIGLNNSNSLHFQDNAAHIESYVRGEGKAVRCVKN
jgi:hypothetical protein